MVKSLIFKSDKCPTVALSASWWKLISTIRQVLGDVLCKSSVSYPGEKLRITMYAEKRKVKFLVML